MSIEASELNTSAWDQSENTARWLVVSKYAHLIHELDLIEAFGFWLKHALPGWSIFRPAIERTRADKQHPVFALYQNGNSLGMYETPMEALARIDNDQLTHEFVSLISDTGTATTLLLLGLSPRRHSWRQAIHFTPDSSQQFVR